LFINRGVNAFLLATKINDNKTPSFKHEQQLIRIQRSFPFTEMSNFWLSPNSWSITKKREKKSKSRQQPFNEHYLLRHLVNKKRKWYWNKTNLPCKKKLIIMKKLRKKIEALFRLELHNSLINWRYQINSTSCRSFDIS